MNAFSGSRDILNFHCVTGLKKAVNDNFVILIFLFIR